MAAHNSQSNSPTHTLVPVGPYTIAHMNGENLRLLYHNREFINVIGNNFVKAVVQEVESLRDQAEFMESAVGNAQRLESLRSVIEYAVAEVSSHERRGVFIQAYYENIPWAVEAFWVGSHRGGQHRYEVPVKYLPRRLHPEKAS